MTQVHFSKVGVLAMRSSPDPVPANTRSPGKLKLEVEAKAVAVLSIVMPTISWTGMFDRCGRRALALCDSLCAEVAGSAELVVAFDGAAPPTPAWLEHPQVKVVETGRQSGPATARNAGARLARGQVLLFVDADVELAADALRRVITAFDADPGLAGLFGAYDDEPAAEGTVSQFRNLLHHHTHVTHPGNAGTFWSGCGAVRAATFLEVGGFDESFRTPSIEDIEMGMRIAARGGRIVLDPELRCKHLKRWTLASMVITDIFSRARPWTQLLMASVSMPRILNIDWKGRASGVLALALVMTLSAAVFWPQASILVPACAAPLLFINRAFYKFCLNRRGLRFALASFALHTLYFCYASITFGWVALETLGQGVLNPRKRGEIQHNDRPTHTPQKNFTR